jgi:tousled-like kinase
MNSREGFPQAGGPDGISPPAVASDRAAKAYEKAFLESANSNESKLRLLEERMKRPPAATAQMSDAVRAGGPDAASDDDDEDEQRDFGVHYSHPEKRRRRSGEKIGRDVSPGDRHKSSERKMPPPGTSAGSQHIEAYFPAADADAAPHLHPGGSRESPVGGALFATPTPRRPHDASGRKENHPPGSRERSVSVSHAHAHSAGNRDLAAALDVAREEASRSKKEADEARRRAETVERALAEARERADAAASDARDAKAREDAALSRERARVDGVKQLAVRLAQHERAQARREMAEVGARLGTVSVQRAGAALQEVWEDGRAFADLARRSRELASAREAADEQRKAVKKLLPPPGAEATPETAARQAEYVLSEEIHKVRVAAMKKEEEGIKNERELLEREKQAHIRVLKRVRDEDASRFNQHPLLGNRYVLMNMLGRGGFSEVYKAFDVVEMREVACKLHQLSPQWSEARKQTYVRHAQRECMIHKRLRHPNVVEMIDVFEVDRDSFCTVLELCTGDDLDARLKSQGPVPEREARAILAQVFAGLAYLNQGPKKIIHYDLKPGNILFDAAGRVKITDFGLSKVDERGANGALAGSSANGGGSLMGDSGMELTSQGAGTYWYLPPECFETGPTPPRISSKVDTWSCGVILYQMLFGRRPFGHDQSQEQILHSGTILNARGVEFPPAGPKVSAEGKAFIQRCLARKQQDRPDVPAAAADAYMTYAKATPE